MKAILREMRDTEKLLELLERKLVLVKERTRKIEKK
jgi:hypothetical protein